MTDSKTRPEEKKDPSLRQVFFAVFLFFSGVILILAIVAAGFWIVDLNLSGPPAEIKQAYEPTEAERIQLEVYPKRDRLELQEQAQKTLTSYGWEDRAGGMTRIPIEQAMKRALQKGYALRTEPGEKEKT